MSIVLPRSILKRQADWWRVEAPPASVPRFAYARRDAPGLVYSAPGAAVVDDAVNGFVDEQKMMLRAIITTIDVDRVGDVVIPEGGFFDHYLHGGAPWFFGHQSIPFPVGTAIRPDGSSSLEVTPGRHVTAECWFHQKTKEAVQVFELVQVGALRGVSIGFNPLSEPIPMPRQRGVQYQGYRYPSWELLENSLVGVAANPYCGVVRRALDLDRLAGDPIAPLLRKSLEPLAEPRRAWSPGFSPSTDSPSKGDKAMATRRKTRPVPACKDMSESSGTGGGYTAPEDGADHHKPHEEIKELAAGHEALAGAGHSYHFNADSGELHHQHPEGAEEKHLKRIKEDMEDVEGVKSVTQEPHAPEDGEGFVKVYPEGEGESHKEPDADDEPMEPKEKRFAAAVARQFSSMPPCARKAILAAIGKASPGVQECVHHKVPKLIAEGHSQDSALAAAFSMCGERKGKAMDDPDSEDGYESKDDMDGDGDDLAELSGEDAEGVAGEDQPALPQGAELLQRIMEHIEGELPTMEATPVREFVEELLGELDEFARIQYPDVDFDGDDIEETEDVPDGEGGYEQRGEGETGTADMGGVADPLSQYRSGKAGRTKSIRRLMRHKRAATRVAKRYVRNDHLSRIKEAAEHLDDMGQMETGAPMERVHKAACRMHAKELHGMHKELSGGGARAEEDVDEESVGEKVDENPQAETPEREKAMSPDELAKAVEGSLAPLHNLIFEVTGQRPRNGNGR